MLFEVAWGINDQYYELCTVWVLFLIARCTCATAEPLLSVSILTRLGVEVRNNERHLLTAAPK